MIKFVAFCQLALQVGASLLRALRCAVERTLASSTVILDLMLLLHIFQRSLVGYCIWYCACSWPDLAKLLVAG